MSGDGGPPKSPDKTKDGTKRLGSLNSGFLSKRSSGLRSGDPSTSQPSASQPAPPVANGQSAPKKSFRPNLNKARNKPQAKAAGSAPSAGAPSAADEKTFADLIKQAQSVKGWEHGGRGRGRDPRLGPQSAQQPYRVMFNSGSVGDPRAMQGQSPQLPSRASGSGGGGSRGTSTAARSSSKLGSAVKQEEVYFNDEEEDEKPEGLAQPMLDYRQYYPTVLPMRPPGHDTCEDEDGLEHNKPPDIAHLPDDEVNVAEMLGVAEKDQAEAEEQVVLLQMPSLLPAPASPPMEDAAAAKLRHQRREDAPPPPVALSLKDLPTGRIGKMLVFKSGAVKMQLGDVLFDMLPGTEAAFRQDIAAVNAAEQACVFLGGISQRVVACPDIVHLLSNEPVMGLQNGVTPHPVQMEMDVDLPDPMHIDVKPEFVS
ncbi:probable DNA-directed RNA polymerase III subunit RPC4 at C-terminar half [Coccomyxa sp. Obi]|nr:probable DNA-directed RNA polymerase III subunit RPC4 at C-terminar half [Coccomyxa sp. Obi]